MTTKVSCNSLQWLLISKTSLGEKEIIDTEPPEEEGKEEENKFEDGEPLRKEEGINSKI